MADEKFRFFSFSLLNLDFLDYLCISMILDVARHKFVEGLVFLALTSLAAMVAAFLHPADGALLLSEGVGVAPLRPLLDGFVAENPVISSLMVMPLFCVAVLRLSRATVRFSLYPSATVAAIALCSLVLLALLPCESMFNSLLVVFFTAKSLGRLLGCFGLNMRPSRLFASMFFLGVLPLLDSSLVVVAVVLPLLVILMRRTLRETVIVVFGVLTPLFTYCYVVWCLGGDFLDAAYHLFFNVLLPAESPVLNYLSLPRVVMLGVLLLMQLAASLFYVSDRMTLNIAARNVWVVLQTILLVFIVSFVLLPSTSEASVLVVVMTLLPMLPLFFLRLPALLSLFSFVVFTLLSVATFVLC